MEVKCRMLMIISLIAYIAFSGVIFWYLQKKYARASVHLIIEDKEGKRVEYKLKKEKAYFEIQKNRVDIVFEHNKWKATVGERTKSVVNGEYIDINSEYSMRIVENSRKAICFEAMLWAIIAVITLTIICFVIKNIDSNGQIHDINLVEETTDVDDDGGQPEVADIDSNEIPDMLDKDTPIEKVEMDEIGIDESDSNVEDSMATDSVDEELKKREKLATHICAGVRYSLALADDGSVQIAYNDINSGFDFSDWNDLISISGKASIILGLTKEGDVYSTCINGFPYSTDVSTQIPTWHNIIQISTGEQFAVGLDNKGKVVGVGRNEDGQCELDDWENIQQIATTHRLTVGLDSDGRLHFAGLHDEEFEQQYESTIDEWKNVTSIYAAGGMHKNEMGHVIGLKSDGTLVAIGDDFVPNANAIADLSDVRLLAVGDYHLVAISSDNEITVLGEAGTIDYSGQNEKEKFDNWPGEEIVELSAGQKLTLATTSEGVVYAAGNEKQGQLGANGWTNVMHNTNE